MMIAQAESPSRLFHHVRHGTHGFGSACHNNARVSKYDLLKPQNDRLESLSACHVDGERRYFLGNSRPVADLTRRIWPITRGSGVPDDDFADYPGSDPRAR